MVNVDLQRQRLIRQAFHLEWLTVGWMAVEAAVAVASGIVAHSITLMAFGLDSVIELASAGVLIWRLSSELRFGRAVSEAAERTARRIAGGLLFALAAYVAAAAAWSLWHGEGADFSWPGLLVALLAIRRAIHSAFSETSRPNLSSFDRRQIRTPAEASSMTLSSPNATRLMLCAATPEAMATPASTAIHATVSHSNQKACRTSL